jgi:hypothetical protein
MFDVHCASVADSVARSTLTCAPKTKPNRQNANFRWFRCTLAKISTSSGSREAERLLRKYLINGDSERVLKISIERPGYRVYWPYGRAVISVTGDANRATN